MAEELPLCNEVASDRTSIQPPTPETPEFALGGQHPEGFNPLTSL